MATPTAPACVGIIMDGNRRFAKRRGLPTLAGHRAGVETLAEIGRAVRAAGVQHLIIYAFSTENWGRSGDEVAYLMDLFRESLEKQMRELRKEGVRIRFVGQRERFSPDLQKAMGDVEKETEHNDSFTLWICLSYGGRAEIVTAARACVADGTEITEEALGAHLWTAGMPDPDIIIRTGGEKRLSGFLAWGSVYSELFFVDTLWPDFTKEQCNAILAEFAARERRHGK